jgi:hypothetical protein
MLLSCVRVTGGSLLRPMESVVSGKPKSSRSALLLCDEPTKAAGLISFQKGLRSKLKATIRLTAILLLISPAAASSSSYCTIFEIKEPGIE